MIHLCENELDLSQTETCVVVCLGNLYIYIRKLAVMICFQKQLAGISAGYIVLLLFILGMIRQPDNEYLSLGHGLSVSRANYSI
jgi:hypothetical protein